MYQGNVYAWGKVTKIGEPYWMLINDGKIDKKKLQIFNIQDQVAPSIRKLRNFLVNIFRSFRIPNRNEM